MDLNDHGGEPPDSILPRPDGRPSLARLADRLRAWAAWFGLGRLVTGAVSMVAVVAGGFWLLHAPAPPTEATLPMATTTTGASTSVAGAVAPTAGPAPTAPVAVAVHVAGAVAAPGVYTLPAGSRVHVAVAAAGGATARGDPGALNLAASVVDGERIYVPMVGETVPIAAAALGPTASTAAAGPVDLNRATSAELDTLPGVGPATAQAIIDHRTLNGPFASVDDLEAVRGIGPAKLEAIRDLVGV